MDRVHKLLTQLVVTVIFRSFSHVRHKIDQFTVEKHFYSRQARGEGDQRKNWTRSVLMRLYVVYNLNQCDYASDDRVAKIGGQIPHPARSQGARTCCSCPLNVGQENLTKWKWVRSFSATNRARITLGSDVIEKRIHGPFDRSLASLTWCYCLLTVLLHQRTLTKSPRSSISDSDTQQIWLPVCTN